MRFFFRCLFRRMLNSIFRAGHRQISIPPRLLSPASYSDNLNKLWIVLKVGFANISVKLLEVHLPMVSCINCPDQASSCIQFWIFNCPCLCRNTNKMYALGVMFVSSDYIVPLGVLVNRHTGVLMEEWVRPMGKRTKNPAVVK